MGKDLPAGLVVFLVALPLCLGIATASGASPLSGVVAGVVGGIVVGAFSKSPLSVSGPAAGLVAVVVGALSQLHGSFPAFQVALILAGGIQILLGAVRLGLIANYVPNSVIKGMLAGIGVLIILKQIPHALGYDKNHEVPYGFVTKLGNTFSDVVSAVLTATPTAAVIFLVGAGVILLWESKLLKDRTWTKFVPGPLIAVLLGAGINQYLLFSNPSIALRASDSHLVNLPPTDKLMSALTWPDWNALSQPQVWTIAITLALVASLETLLSIDAADKLDTRRRITPANRELVAQGIGNTVSGLLGGLPITSVVLRTSANAYSGAQSKASTIVHGILLALVAATIPTLINTIPLASLASVLILVGWKLTKPSVFKKAFSQGWDQFLPFLATLLGVVFTDLLKGVMIGMGVGIFFVVRAYHHDSLTLVNDGKDWLLRFNKDVTFTSKISLRNLLDKIPDNSTVLVSGSKADFIDRDIMEMITDFVESGKFRGIQVEFFDVDNKIGLIRPNNKK